MKKIMGALLALSLFVGVATVTFAQGTDTDKKAGKKKGGKKGGTDKGTDKGDKSTK